LDVVPNVVSKYRIYNLLFVPVFGVYTAIGSLFFQSLTPNFLHKLNKQKDVSNAASTDACIQLLPNAAAYQTK
jgi:hypothetical protein